LQLRLCNAINVVAESRKIAYAFPELRSFGTRSIVPNVAVFEWSRIQFDADGEAPNDFLMHPDWMIEILSPEQSSNRVIGNILYGIRHGCRLGWLLDPGSLAPSFPAQTTTRTVPGDDRLPLEGMS